MPLTDNEVFDVYGLILGMIYSEDKSRRIHGDVRSPAREWANFWLGSPSLKKAHEIYTKVADRKTAVYHAKNRRRNKRSTK